MLVHQRVLKIGSPPLFLTFFCPKKDWDMTHCLYKRGVSLHFQKHSDFPQFLVSSWSVLSVPTESKGSKDLMADWKCWKDTFRQAAQGLEVDSLMVCYHRFGLCHMLCIIVIYIYTVYRFLHRHPKGPDINCVCIYSHILIYLFMFVIIAVMMCKSSSQKNDSPRVPTLRFRFAPAFPAGCRPASCPRPIWTPGDLWNVKTYGKTHGRTDSTRKFYNFSSTLGWFPKNVCND